MLIAYEMVEGRRLDQVHGDEVSDRFLRDVWAQVARLREHRIAHRDLRRANVLVDTDGEPWLTGFAFSEVAASDDQLDGDVAQLLAALSLTVGADRSVTERGRDTRSGDGRRRAPRLQPNALSDSTRDRARREQPGSAGGAAGHRRAAVRGERAELRPARADQPAAPLHRGDARGGHLLPPAAAGRPAGRLPRDRRRRLELGPARRAVLGADLRRRRARHRRRGARSACRAVPTLLAQVAASFASNLAPAGVGGMALNVRYLQKSGVDAPVAASSVGLNAVAGFAVHIGLMFVFFVWAGHSALGSISTAQLVGRRHRRRRRRRVRRGRVRDPGHPRAVAHEARPRARPRVEWSRRGDPQPGQDRAAVRRIRRWSR